MSKERNPASDITLPALRRQAEREAQCEHALDPSLEHGGKPDEVHRGDERKRVRRLHFLLLDCDVFGSMALQQPDDAAYRDRPTIA